MQDTQDKRGAGEDAYELYDGLAFGEAGSAAALPSEWRLLKARENRLLKSGQPYVLTLSEQDIAGAAALQRSKGEKIPLDSRHALYLAARRAGVEEREALRAVPQGTAALGFGNLAARHFASPPPPGMAGGAVPRLLLPSTSVLAPEPSVIH